MDTVLNGLSFLEVMNDILDSSYKSERIAKFIKEFDDHWRQSDYSVPDDGIHRIWGTELIVDDLNIEISEFLHDPMFSKIVNFFETKDKKIVKEINEDDLIDLLYCEGVGKVKYSTLMKMLFGDERLIESSNVEEAEIVSALDNTTEADTVCTLGLEQLLDNTLDEVNHILEETRQKLISKNNDISLLLDRKDLELKHITEEYEKEKSKNASLDSDIKKHLYEVNEKEQIISSLKDDLYWKDVELDNRKTEIEHYKTETDNYKKETDRYRKEIEIYKAEIDKYEKEIENYETQTEEYQEEIESQKEEIDNLKEEIDVHKNTIAEFSSIKGIVDNILDKFRKKQ